MSAATTEAGRNEITDLCAIAGRPELADERIAAGCTLEDVRTELGMTPRGGSVSTLLADDMKARVEARNLGLEQGGQR